MNAYYLVARSVDPYHNLAVEEHLLDTIPDNTLVLFIWRSWRAVVIGRHQNPWKETDCAYMSREGIVLARRISGGGAVYHDLGNLNFSFIADRRIFNIELQIRAVCESMKRFGIRATAGTRNELLFQGRKFSGSAYAYRRTRALHHGTLMVDTDIGMFGALNGRMQIPWSRGTESVQADVINLKTLAPVISVEDAAESIRLRYGEMTGCRFINIETNDVCDGAGLAQLQAKNRSWDWLYGSTPAFETELGGEDNRLVLCIERGRVYDVKSLDNNLPAHSG